MEILIATRSYSIPDLKARRDYTARDLLYRLPCGSFVLRETSDMPEERGGETSYSLDGVYAWLREMPEQIERALIRLR